MVVGTLQTISDTAEQDRLEHQAADALREGKLVILPTETVYGIFASAQHPHALDRLAALTMPNPEQNVRERFAWITHSLETVFSAVPVHWARHRRLMQRLQPGPVRFHLELDAGAMDRALRAIGVTPGILDKEGNLALRVCGHPVTQRILKLAGIPVVANRLAAAGWAPDRNPDTALADDKAAQAGIALTIDDGPAMFGRQSTLILLNSRGGFLIEHEGAYDSRMIEKHTRTRILFVCTGNTCRSPMAEAIAQHLLEHSPQYHSGDAEITALSAGVSANTGSPASPQTEGALRSLGIEPRSHAARQLSRQLIAESDVIYTMNAWHRDEILGLDPTAATKVSLLDPARQDVPDPVGLPQEVYNQTAARLLTLVQQRLTELGALERTTPGEDTR